MSWKCSKCGFSANVDNTATCSGCGDVRLGKLVLVSQVSGGQMTMAITTTVGRSILRTFAGDDARYASEPQFTVTADAVGGRWMIQKDPGARNPTCVDGVELADAPQPLVSGNVISIGPDRMKLTVRQEF